MRLDRLRQFIVSPLIASLLLMSWACSASGPSNERARQYDGLPYRDTFIHPEASGLVYRAAIQALQDKGAVVTMSDSRSGLLNAEIHRTSPLPEEEYDGQTSSKNDQNTAGVLAVILGLILFIVLFGWLSGGCSGCSTDDEPERRHEGPPHRPPEPVGALTYIFSLTFFSLSDGSTQVRISTTRQTVQNGTVTESVPLQNKYLNYELHDAIRASLTATRR